MGMAYCNDNRLIQIKERTIDEFHAGRKAPQDVSQIATNLGFNNLDIHRDTALNRWWRGIMSLKWILKCCGIILRLPSHPIILIQHPCGLFSGRLGFAFIDNLKRWRKAKIIILIHDLDCIRMHENVDMVQLDDKTRMILDCSDVLIVHNDNMRRWLSARGVLNEKMIVLGLFDYLPNNEVIFHYTYHKIPTVIIAGNLDNRKSSYINEIGCIRNVKWNLYGPNYEPIKSKECNIAYCGCYTPELLQSKIKGMYGLVWDGDSIDSCTGYSGEYLKYNNPHKLSFYLSCGIPVIVWTGAAVSDLILKERVGISVSSLRDLENVLMAITQESYEQLCQNAAAISRKIRAGEFLTVALKQSLLKVAPCHTRMCK